MKIRMKIKVKINLFGILVKPRVIKNHGSNSNIILNQDSAAAHSAKVGFCSKTFTPPSSPDGNRLEFSLWATSSKSL